MASTLTPNKKHIAIILAVCFLIADRLAKILALFNFKKIILNNFLSFELNRNFDLALSLVLGFNPLWLVLPIILILIFWIIIYYKKNKTLSTVLLFIVLGAVSNLYDRLVYGYVIDYFNLASINVFNVADLMIVGGALKLFYDEYLSSAKK